MAFSQFLGSKILRVNEKAHGKGTRKSFYDLNRCVCGSVVANDHLGRRPGLRGDSGSCYSKKSTVEATRRHGQIVTYAL